MPMFEKAVRNPHEFTFKDDFRGRAAQQVVKELDGKSNLLMDAVYMKSNEDTRHRGRRNEEIKDTAVTVASDEGHPYSAGTHEVEYTTELGLVADGCKFDSIEEDNAPNADVISTERQDISDTMESVNRKDAWMAVYGDQRVDPKGWNGLAYYTRKVTTRSTFEQNFYAGINPFEGEDLCLTIDNQADASSSATKLSASYGNIFGSIWAVVWDKNYVAKIYPKESDTYGIDTTVSPVSTVWNANNDRWHTQRMIAFRKGSGVNVHNRFGLIRIANVNFDKIVHTTAAPTTDVNHDVKEEYERLCANMAFVEEIYQKLGITSKVKFYCPTPLIRKMRAARAMGNASQSNIYYSIPGVEQAGQIHGIMADKFYINDNYLVTPEFQMVATEAFLA